MVDCEVEGWRPFARLRTGCCQRRACHVRRFMGVRLPVRAALRSYALPEACQAASTGKRPDPSGMSRSKSPRANRTDGQSMNTARLHAGCRQRRACRVQRFMGVRLLVRAALRSYVLPEACQAASTGQRPIHREVHSREVHGRIGSGQSMNAARLRAGCC